MPSPQLSPSEFADRYIKRSGVTSDFLISNDSVVVTCDCEAHNCLGWQMQNQQWVDMLKEDDMWPSKWEVFPLTEMFRS